jgi:hypothetical protein
MTEKSMTHVRTADDYKAIRLRMDELRRERQQRYGSSEPIVEKPIREPDAVAHVPGHIVRRYLTDTRRTPTR